MNWESIRKLFNRAAKTAEPELFPEQNLGMQAGFPPPLAPAMTPPSGIDEELARRKIWQTSMRREALLPETTLYHRELAEELGKIDDNLRRVTEKAREDRERLVKNFMETKLALKETFSKYDENIFDPSLHHQDSHNLHIPERKSRLTPIEETFEKSPYINIPGVDAFETEKNTADYPLARGINSRRKSILSLFGIGKPEAALYVFPQMPALPVTPESAVQIFDHLANMPDIAFGYADDGCYARAHIMCKRMYDMGLTPKKAWAFETDSQRLQVETPDGKKVEWWYHVAAALPVLMPDGNVQDMVIDPSLFDGPVTLAQWGKVMGARPENLAICRCGESPASHYADYAPGTPTTVVTDQLAAETMTSYLAYQTTSKPVVFNSSFKEFVFQQQDSGARLESASPVMATGSNMTDNTGAPQRRTRLSQIKNTL